MLAVLQFVMSSFWVFIGTLMLISTTGYAVARIILACNGVRSD